jgi:hypothetical protein
MSWLNHTVATAREIFLAVAIGTVLGPIIVALTILG